MPDTVKCPHCGRAVPAPLAEEEPRHPLPIVLTNAEKRRWDEHKATLGVKDDRAALMALL